MICLNASVACPALVLDRFYGRYRTSFADQPQKYGNRGHDICDTGNVQLLKWFCHPD